MLEKLGLKYEDLNEAEIASLDKKLSMLAQRALTIEDVREMINNMKDGVEMELSETTHNRTQDIYLKARLRNYLLILSFLSGPERAKRALDRTLAASFKPKTL